MSYPGLLTGIMLPDPTGRGRPRQFVNDDARVAWHALMRFQTLLGRLVADPGFVPVSESQLRGFLMQLANMLNQNTHPEAVALRRKRAQAAADKRKAKKGAKRRENPAPAPVTHGLLSTDKSGRMHALCGPVELRRVPNPLGGTIAIPRHDAIAWDDDAVTCASCRQKIAYRNGRGASV